MITYNSDTLRWSIFGLHSSVIGLERKRETNIDKLVDNIRFAAYNGEDCPTVSIKYIERHKAKMREGETVKVWMDGQAFIAQKDSSMTMRKENTLKRHARDIYS